MERMERKVKAVYFSPTHSTQKLTKKFAEKLSENYGNIICECNLTRPEMRDKDYSFDKSDILVLGFPIYGGRIPFLLEESFLKIKGNDTPAVVIGVYGNRDFEDALLEAQDVLEKNGFKVIGAGAFIGEHSYTKNVAGGRPDNTDIEKVKKFAEKIQEKINNSNIEDDLKVSGHFPYKERGVGFLAAPKTTQACYACMRCVEECPVSTISRDDPKEACDEKCIHCCACVKVCPVGAKYFDNEIIRKFTLMLEANFAQRKEPVVFI